MWHFNKGELLYADGKVFRGEWSDDMFCGYGVLEEEGKTYRGYWFKNRKHGLGVIIYGNEVFVGSFFKDQVKEISVRLINDKEEVKVIKNGEVELMKGKSLLKVKESEKYKEMMRFYRDENEKMHKK